MIKYDANNEWTKSYSLINQIPYPSEYVIRIFKGAYPKINFEKKSFERKKICDIGFGTGRNLVFLHECGFDLYGTEISKEIVDMTKNNLCKMSILTDLKIGRNDLLPFENDFFDFLLSWNSCYYMGQNYDFNTHVLEMARIMKDKGYLIMSIPMKTNFIFIDSEEFKQGYRIIRKDPFNVRNGEILKIFEDDNEIKETFSKYFDNFIFASIYDDCFGYNYHWHVIICQKK